MVSHAVKDRFKLAITVGACVSPRTPVLLGGQLSDTLSKAKAYGYEAIELQFPNATMLDIQELKSLLDINGLVVSAVATGGAYVIDRLSLTDDSVNIRDAAIQRVSACIDVAHELESMVIIGCVRGNVPERADIDEYLFRLSESLNQVSAFAQSKGVQLVLEAINRYENNFLNSAAKVSDFIKYTGLKNIKIHLDSFHMNIEEPDIFESLAKYKDEIGYIHLADSNRMYPGAGHLDLKKFINICEDMGYAGYFSAEYLPLPDSETAAAQFIDFFRNTRLSLEEKNHDWTAERLMY
jgi:sugar phosphate isomerase/epimerase